MPDSPADRGAARAAGQRRVQTVTTWATAGSVVAAGVLTAVLAHGTSSAATTSDQNDQNGGSQVGGTSPDGGITGDGQLQAPEFLPGVAGRQGRHGSSGGS
ncbi:MAG TPA: hypothetical protein VH333_16715 [Pseudonocardiaceae bacterium]|nr:hypothetical protein [Pseudonocardiaceae bacterium]